MQEIITTTSTEQKLETVKNIYYDVSLFSQEDIYLHKEGSHFRLYNKFGSHLLLRDNVLGTYFSVWAPNANQVSIIGDLMGGIEIAIL